LQTVHRIDCVYAPVTGKRGKASIADVLDDTATTLADRCRAPSIPLVEEFRDGKRI